MSLFDIILRNYSNKKTKVFEFSAKDLDENGKIKIFHDFVGDEFHVTAHYMIEGQNRLGGQGETFWKPILGGVIEVDVKTDTNFKGVMCLQITGSKVYGDSGYLDEIKQNLLGEVLRRKFGLLKDDVTQKDLITCAELLVETLKQEQTR